MIENIVHRILILNPICYQMEKSEVVESNHVQMLKDALGKIY